MHRPKFEKNGLCYGPIIYYVFAWKCNLELCQYCRNLCFWLYSRRSSIFFITFLLKVASRIKFGTKLGSPRWPCRWSRLQEILENGILTAQWHRWASKLPPRLLKCCSREPKWALRTLKMCQNWWKPDKQNIATPSNFTQSICSFNAQPNFKQNVFRGCTCKQANTFLQVGGLPLRYIYI